MFSKKYVRWLTGATLTLGLALAGTFALAGGAFAQTAPPAATAASTPAPATGAPGAPQAPPDGNKVAPPGMAGGPDGGPGGMGGDRRGPGGSGAAATADGAAQAVSMTTQILTTAQTDLAYATGKMDTSSVAGWLTAADGLLSKATAAQTAQQYGQAGAYAEAARTLVATAETAMSQALGADKLPSYSQQAQRGGPGGNMPQGQAPTQAQTSRELQNTYNRIISQGALVGTNADAAGYLTQAQNAYKTAYTAYQAGTYQAAHDAARLAESLLRVSDSLLHVADAATSPDAPVTVPAPNF